MNDKMREGDREEESCARVCVCKRDREIDKERGGGNFMRGPCSAAVAEKKTIISARWLPNESSLNYQPS